jgi:uncharacterized protein (TIGR02145 family)
MKHIISQLLFYIFLLIFLPAITGCKKLEKIMLVSTITVTNVTTNSADVSGRIIDLGNGITAYGFCYGQTTNPTVNDSRIQLGLPADTGFFNSQLTNLVQGKTYYFKAYISHGNETTVYGEEKSFTTKNNVSDIDGNVYNAVQIRTQTWMKENLKVQHYNNGDPIPNITDNNTWSNLSTGACCDYSNDPANTNTYGHLYNFYTVADSRKLCMTGWHVPTDADWTTLTDYLTNNSFGYQGSGNDIGKSMASVSVWKSNSAAGTVGNDQTSNNASGFSAVPGGYRSNSNGNFIDITQSAFFWSGSILDANNTLYRSLRFDNSLVDRQGFSKNGGLSIRCVKD